MPTFFSSVTEFNNRTILTVNLHILDQWNQQENDIRMSDDWWFWFISISPILNAFRLDQFFFSRVFSFSFLKNVKYEKSKSFSYTHWGSPIYASISTLDSNTPIFGLCTRKCIQPIRTLFLFKSIWIHSQGSQGLEKIRIFFNR